MGRTHLSSAPPSAAPTPPHEWGGQNKKPGLHRTPARNGLTKRLMRSVLLLLRGLLRCLLCRLLRGLLLRCHHALPPSPKDLDPIGSIGFAANPSSMRTPRRWRLVEMDAFLVPGPSPLWWQPRAASPYRVL